MPLFKQPNSLSNCCLNNIVQNMDSYWIDNNYHIKEYIDDPRSKHTYILSPLETLNDQHVDYIIRALYAKNSLTKYHLHFLIHNRLRSLDFSFITKRALMSNQLCAHISKNCTNLVELNLFAQSELNPMYICLILFNQKNLRKLNLSHTKANEKVIAMIIKKGFKLVDLNLENCQNLHEECIEEVALELSDSLEYLNVDNIKISQLIIGSILINCKKLKFFYATGLLNLIEGLLRDGDIDENQNVQTDLCQLNLDTFYIDADIILRPAMVQSLSLTCPKLKKLRINCVGSNSSLMHLNNFAYLTELLIANTMSLLSFQFNGYLLESLKTSIGKQLKSLHLIYIVDVNLRSICNYCSNLVSLNVEFLGYYEPANDPNNNENQACIKSLRNLSISNLSHKLDHIALNIGQFKKDLTLLLNNGQVRNLYLSGLHELDDEYFKCLFTTPVSVNFKMQYRNSNIQQIYQSIEKIEMSQMNGISPEIVIDCLVRRTDNHLKHVILKECKKIGKSNHKFMNSLVNHFNLNCKIEWT